jgi:hypothetical protein
MKSSSRHEARKRRIWLEIKPFAWGSPVVLPPWEPAPRGYLARGGDVDAVFGRGGIDPEFLSDPTLSTSLRSYCPPFENAAQTLHEDTPGLWFGQQVKPTDLGLIG